MADFNGDDGANVLDGSIDGDTMSALAGSDIVNGAEGADTMSGGEGSDTLNGGAGNDIIYGFGASDAIAGSGDINATLVTSALARPIFALSAPGNADRMFVAQQGGIIKILDPATGALRATPFLNIASTIGTGGERGLLGLAFDPDYVSNGKFYVYVNNTDGDIEVRSYLRSATNANRADPASGNVILTIPHPTFANHNGGWMGFGPDGYLYISVGDGGSGGDPSNNAQNTNVLLGKMLRIDVSSDAFPGDALRDYAIPADNPFADGPGADEIWALGLRNAWRPSFDRLTGDLYIADVGQNAHEEINFQLAGSDGGANYGWKVKEGFDVFDDTVPGNPPADSPTLTDPLIDYPHVNSAAGGFSVTGGYVYRGSAAGLQGVYLYADFVSNQVWSFRVVDGAAVDAVNRTAQFVVSGGSVNSIASFAEDGHGNLYVLGLDGEMFRLDPQVGAGDSADIIDGGQGNDQIFGGAGNDSLIGGAGRDGLDGGSQDDILNGGGNADTLSGGAGVDRLIGATGDDQMTGGAGGDLFVFGRNGGHDTIADFENDVDAIRLSRALGIASVDDALALAVETSGHVVFSFASGEVLMVLNTTKFELTDDLLV